MAYFIYLHIQPIHFLELKTHTSSIIFNISIWPSNRHIKQNPYLSTQTCPSHSLSHCSKWQVHSLNFSARNLKVILDSPLSYATTNLVSSALEIFPEGDHFSPPVLPLLGPPFHLYPPNSFSAGSQHDTLMPPCPPLPPFSLTHFSLSTLAFSVSLE